MKLKSVVLSLTLLLACSWSASAAVTLRSLGAKGDGSTDDRAAIEAALKQSAGQPVDGEGLTYSVNGSIRVTNDVDLRNANFRQTMVPVDTSLFIRSHTTTTEPTSLNPPGSLRKMSNGHPVFTAQAVAKYDEDPKLEEKDYRAVIDMVTVCTLSVRGEEKKPVSVKLEKVKIQRGSHPESGMHSNSAGLHLTNASPVTLTDVEISGDGKGSGLYLYRCDKVRMDRLDIHDILWAPYKGDIEWTAAELGHVDFGWNNSPIYDFSNRDRQFVRVRVQEQVVGMSIFSCNDVELTNSRIHRVGTMIEGRFHAWQADGITANDVKNITIRDCSISEVWEGIDFTGRGVDGFLQENVHISDTFSYGFKYAHPNKNGRVIRCVSVKAGLRGYTISSQSDNITFTECVARETGSNKFWWRDGKPLSICGFSLETQENELPRNVTLKDCSAINTEFPGYMRHGFSTAARATAPELQNRLINPTVAGALESPINNFRQ